MVQIYSFLFQQYTLEVLASCAAAAAAAGLMCLQMDVLTIRRGWRRRREGRGGDSATVAGHQQSSQTGESVMELLSDTHFLNILTCSLSFKVSRTELV